MRSPMWGAGLKSEFPMSLNFALGRHHIQPPIINYFNANPSSTLNPGDPSLISWSVTNADTKLGSIVISPTIGDVTNTPTGSFTVNPITTTQYTLTAYAARMISSQAFATVTVASQPPVINSFQVSPNPIVQGNSATLSWNVSGANSATGGIVITANPTTAPFPLDESATPINSISVTPAATTSYTLTATSISGLQATQTVSLTVNNLPVISLTLDKQTIMSGESALLSWTVTGSDSQVMSGGVFGSGTSIAATGSQSVSPTTTTLYTLVATKIGVGQSSRSILLTVGTGAFNVPSNTWVEMPGTALHALIMPWDTPEQPLETDGSGIIQQGFSGGAYDTKRDKLIIAVSGGHNDWGENDVYSFVGPNNFVPRRERDRSNNIVKGQSVQFGGEPSTGGFYGTGGAPTSVHTLDGQIYLPNIDKVIQIGGSRWDVNGTPINTVWSLDTSTYGGDSRKESAGGTPATWTRLQDAPPDLTALMISTVYDPLTGHVWVRGHSYLWDVDFTASPPIWTAVTNQEAGWASGYKLVLDPNRRLLFQLGNTDPPLDNPQCYMYDLNGNPPYTVQNIYASCTGAKAAAFAQYFPGAAYHPPTGLIVIYAGNGAGTVPGNIYTFDPATRDVQLITPTNGTLPGNPPRQGISGRFFYSPHYDLFGTINGCSNEPSQANYNTNLFLYRLTDRVNLAPKTWMTRPYPPVLTTQNGPYRGGLGKHLRMVYHPTRKRIYTLGGDWNSSSGVSQYNNEVYTYNTLTGEWVLITDNQVPAGQVQPGFPDLVGVCVDTKRDRVWMIPGSERTPPAQYPPYVYQRVMYLDCATGLWVDTGITPPAILLSEACQSMHYDRQKDQIIGLASNTFESPVFQWSFDPNTLTFSTLNYFNNATFNVVSSTLQAFDPARRWIWWIDPADYDYTGIDPPHYNPPDPTKPLAALQYGPYQGYLFRYWVDTGVNEFIGRAPKGNRRHDPNSGLFANAYDGASRLHYDAVNNVLLYGFTSTQGSYGTSWECAQCSMWIYHIDTNSWEPDPTQRLVAGISGLNMYFSTLPDGSTAGGVSQVFDPDQNVVMQYGSRIVPQGPYFYRYI